MNRHQHTARGHSVERGDEAPDFRLRRTFDSEVSLSDLLESGPLVLCFYVFDFGDV